MSGVVAYENKQSHWTLPFPTVLDRLGARVSVASKAFDCYAATQDGKTISCYDAVKVCETLCKKEVRIDEAFRTDESCGFPDVAGRLTHSQFLRLVLGQMEPDSSSSSGDGSGSSGGSGGSGDSGYGKVASKKEEAMPSRPTLDLLHHTSQTTLGAKQEAAKLSDEELDGIRRARVRKFELDCGLPFVTAEPKEAPGRESQTATSGVVPSTGAQGKGSEKKDCMGAGVRFVERAKQDFPTLANDTEASLWFIMLQFWSGLASLSLLFAPAPEAAPEGASKNLKRRILGCFVEYDRGGLYFQEKRFASDVSINRTDFSKVMMVISRKLLIGVSLVSPMMAWVAGSAYWDHQLHSITAVATLSGEERELSWADFLQALKHLSHFAAGQAAKFREQIALEIWKSVKSRALGSAAKKIQMQNEVEAVRRRQQRLTDNARVKMEQIYAREKAEQDLRVLAQRAQMVPNPSEAEEKNEARENEAKAEEDKGGGAGEEKSADSAEKHVEYVELDPETLLPVKVREKEKKNQEDKKEEDEKEEKEEKEKEEREEKMEEEEHEWEGNKRKEGKK